LPSDSSVVRAFRTGVSLHGHTEHSLERLAELPALLERIPVVAQFLQLENERHLAATGKQIDFSRVYWRGPVSARSAYSLERHQIEQLGLAALVSLTDHDDLEAGVMLSQDDPDEDIPISVEWSVPFEKSYFHIGIHNLPVRQARSLMSAMTEYTSRREPALLGELLEQFDSMPEVLIVFNHPLWDMGRLGAYGTLALAERFMKLYGRYVHALEINGLRAWNENLGAVRFALDWHKPVVSGGDRHGFEPNAVINLTRATTFAGFVNEIRRERSSDIAVLPHYGEPLMLRHLLTAWDAVREHPQLDGKRRWVSRVFIRDDNGNERPLSGVWKGGAPRWIDPCLNVVGLLASGPVRAAGRLAGFGLRGAV
jgi:hypothetical protein